MRPIVWILAVTTVAAIGFGIAIWNGGWTGDKSASFDLPAGAALYAQNCAECHGINLEGQENWQSRDNDGRFRAPPHDETGHTWHHTDEVLFSYTKLGGREMMAAKGMEFDSGMPGFGDQLTDQEIWNILAFIKSTWPDQIREVQSKRTEGATLRKEN